MPQPVFTPKSALRQAERLYRFVEPFGPDTCTYCGAASDAPDYVLPLFFAATLDTSNPYELREHHGALLCVPACRECISGSRHEMFKSLRDKRKYIAVRMARKHRKLLGAYDWGDAELEEFGHNLRTYLRGTESRRQSISARLAFARAPIRGQL